MKLSSWNSLVLLPLLSSCVFVGTMAGQKPRSVPPQKMRLCVTVNGKAECINLAWASENYEGRKDGETRIENRYWITEWDDGHVMLKGQTSYAVGGVFPLSATIDGPIAADGAHMAGTLEWRIGYSSSGTLPYKLSWSKDPLNAINLYVGQFQAIKYSQTNKDIILPPGASEAYVSYPVDVRALLQPDMPLLEKYAYQSCEFPLANEKVALEIARYAYRAGDIERGNCWTSAASEMGSGHANALLAVGYQMGWRGPKNDVKAFGMLKLMLSKRDPWVILFLYNCYTDGKGTEKNAHEAAILSSYMITHDDTMAVMDMVGSDDASLMRQKARLELLVNPPTKSETHCSQPYVTAGGVKVAPRCETQSTVDSDAIQKRLSDIDSKKE